MTGILNDQPPEALWLDPENETGFIGCALGDLVEYRVYDKDAFSYNKITETLFVTKITDKSIIGVKCYGDGTPDLDWDGKTQNGRIPLSRLGSGTWEDRIILVMTRAELAPAKAKAEAEAKALKARAERRAALGDAAMERRDRARERSATIRAKITEARVAVWDAFVASPEGQALLAAQNEAAAAAAAEAQAGSEPIEGWTVNGGNLLFATEEEAREWASLGKPGDYDVGKKTQDIDTARDYIITGRRF